VKASPCSDTEAEREALITEFQRIAKQITDPAYQAALERRVFPRLQRAFRQNLPSYRAPLVPR
jgi:hypothetical protein